MTDNLSNQVAAMREKLEREVDLSIDEHGIERGHRNPDGPEASALLGVLADRLAEAERVIEGLREIGEHIDRHWWPDSNNPLAVMDGHELLGTIGSEIFRAARTFLGASQ